MTCVATKVDITCSGSQMASNYESGQRWQSLTAILDGRVWPPMVITQELNINERIHQISSTLLLWHNFTKLLSLSYSFEAVGQNQSKAEMLDISEQQCDEYLANY